MTKKKQLLLSAAMAGILGAGAFAHADDAAKPAEAKGAKKAAKVHCYGVNKCAGKGKCSTAGMNECAGKNSCKGKGWVELSKAMCSKKKGTTEAPKAETPAPAPQK